MKTITIYKLAELVLDYNGNSTKPEKVHQFAKTVKRIPEVYINFCKVRGLL